MIKRRQWEGSNGLGIDFGACKSSAVYRLTGLRSGVKTREESEYELHNEWTSFASKISNNISYCYSNSHNVELRLIEEILYVEFAQSFFFKKPLLHTTAPPIIMSSEAPQWCFSLCASVFGRFYAGPNLTPAILTLALIRPVQKFAPLPFRAAFYATQRARKKKLIMVIFTYFYIICLCRSTLLLSLY